MASRNHFKKTVPHGARDSGGLRVSSAVASREQCPHRFGVRSFLALPVEISLETGLNPGVSNHSAASLSSLNSYTSSEWPVPFKTIFFLSTLDALRPCKKKKKKKVQLGKSSGDQKAGCVPFANPSSEAESETGTSLLSTKRSSRKHCSPLKEVLKNQNSKTKIHQSVGKAFRIVKVSKAEERSLYGVGTKRWRHVWLISTLRHT